MKALKISCLVLAILIPLALGTSATAEASEQSATSQEAMPMQKTILKDEGDVGFEIGKPNLTAKEAAKAELAPYYNICISNLNLSKSEKAELEIMKHIIWNPYCCYEGQTTSERLDCLKKSYDDLKIIERTLCMLSKANLDYDPSGTGYLGVSNKHIFSLDDLLGCDDAISSPDHSGIFGSTEQKIDTHLSKIKQALDNSYDYFKKIYNKMNPKTKLMELRAK